MVEVAQRRQSTSFKHSGSVWIFKFFEKRHERTPSVRTRMCASVESSWELSILRVVSVITRTIPLFILFRRPPTDQFEPFPPCYRRAIASVNLLA